ncbi:MAG: helix-turn-helix transcriptional regulator [Cohaesibacteraceae bacterium]|nr:helix-turn-helix transcriptional regulator [Cohaesibacteraceae bacterium]
MAQRIMTVQGKTSPRIGERVKSFRKDKGLSLSEVSRQSNISEATLSRIENEQTLVSAANLYILSQVLDVDITAFFEDASKPIRNGVRSIARKNQGIELETARYKAQVLCTDLSSKKMHPAIDTIAARTLDDAGGYNAHPGEEYLYVLKGKLILYSEHYAPLLLDETDSIYFDGTMGHAYVSGSSIPAQILVITTTDLAGLDDKNG